MMTMINWREEMMLVGFELMDVEMKKKMQKALWRKQEMPRKKATGEWNDLIGKLPIWSLKFT